MRYLSFLCLMVVLALLSACDDSQEKILLTEEESSWIASHREVDVIAVQAWQNKSTTRASFEFKGAEFFILKHIEEKLGLRFNLIRVKKISELKEVVDAKRTKMIIGVSRDYIDDLDLGKHYYFTRPYVSLPLMAVSRRSHNAIYDVDDLQGQKIAFTANARLQAWLLGGDGKEISVLSTANSTEALQMVRDRQADVALVSELFSRYLLRNRFPELKSAGMLPGYYFIYKIGVDKEQPILYGIIKKTLDSMSAEEANSLRVEWELEQGRQTTSYGIVQNYTKEFVVIMLTFLALIFLVYSTRKLLHKARLGEAAKSEFMAVMSHELRTPMNAIIAAGELLQTTPLNNKQKELLEHSNLAANNLLQLLNDILGYSRLDANKELLQLEFVDVDKALDNIVKLYFSSAKIKDIELHYKSNLPNNTLLLDLFHLQRVLHNLMANAVKFTERGSVTLIANCYADPINKHYGRLICQIVDTGIGITAEAQKNIFDPFVQVDTNINRKFGGSGLGLAICKRLVELMQGTISLESDGISGTTITVNIPVQIGEVLLLQKSEPEFVVDEFKHVGAGQRVLVVDDHPANQQIISEQLQLLGCQPIVAGTGISGLSILNENDDIKLLLLDCYLPGMSGYEVAAKIRADEKLKGSAKFLPIIAISAANDYAHRTRCLNSGMNGLLVKPLHLRDLQNILILWLPEVLTEEEVSLPAQPASTDLWSLFIDTNEADFAKAEQAIANRDFDLARQQMHRIYGAALSMKQVELATIAGQLESMLQQDQLENLPAMMQELREVLNMLA
ncbi:ATP-binding protein [Neisseriaceae bacterium TC5R-5]|nr:ATP-binding protein [Neisseriaceae bacterium TC5R-5]